MKHVVRAAGIALAAMILSVLPWTAQFSGMARAEAPAVVVKAAKLYAKPDTSSRRMTTVKKGKMLVLCATNGAWSKVIYQGKVGYLARKNIDSQNAKEMYAAKNVKLKAKNATSSGTLCTVKSGETVYILATKGSWCKALYAGHTGFLPKSAVTADKNAPTVKTTAKPESEAKNAYAKKKIKIYKKASTSSAAVIAAPKGAVLTCCATKGGWAKVKYKGKTGYTPLKNLSEKPIAASVPASTPKPTATPAPRDGLKPGDTGEEVKKLQTQLKKLGWFTGTIGGNYLTRTTQAVKDFQEAAKLEATGIATEKTLERLFSSDAPKCDASNEGTAKPASGKVVAKDWWTSDIRSIFYKGRTVVVTDVRTGISWREVRLGGTNHADTEPASAKDTAALKKVYGGSWSWNRRPVWVSINGVRYAASMNGMPHGKGPRDNGFSGHHCIHFVNSRTHGSNRVDEAHQAAIKEALAAQ